MYASETIKKIGQLEKGNRYRKAIISLTIKDHKNPDVQLPLTTINGVVLRLVR